MWDERSTTRDREPVLLRDVLAATTAALQRASREAAAVAASATEAATEAVMPGPRCGECGAETRRAARAIPGRRPRPGPGAVGSVAGACPNRSAA